MQLLLLARRVDLSVTKNRNAPRGLSKSGSLTALLRDMACISSKRELDAPDVSRTGTIVVWADCNWEDVLLLKSESHAIVNLSTLYQL